MENPQFLTEQIITYLGNKRALLSFIDETLNIVKSELNKKKSLHLMFFQVQVSLLDYLNSTLKNFLLMILKIIVGY